jgi:amino acid transporter
MAERRLKRELKLPQVLMLGIAGTISAGIFILTGHIAGLSGPANVLMMVLLGMLSIAFALNYAELATTYPVTGGALTYMHKAYGNGLHTFWVGSFASLSSVFYCTLSSLGFAYSLRTFLPFIPIVPVAIVIILAFTVLNLFGISSVGRAQLLLGSILLTCLGVYIVAGLVQPQGFSWHRFMPDGEFFIHDDVGTNLSMMLKTMALIFTAFVGFELIADDAEEVENPSRNIPIALMGSLAVITIINTVVALVTLGTIPWFDLAGSETALTQASMRFLPGVGPIIIGTAGIIATITSLNTAMLSATRQALTMSRLGLWPKVMSRLGRLHTPYVAILFVGIAAALMSIVGLVDILSYISSSGYLFVMFWSGLAMIRLRRLYPKIERPYRVPLFPLSAYVQIGTCIIVIAFTDRVALLFGASVLALLTLLYYLRAPLAEMVSERAEAAELAHDRLLVAVANPRTSEGLAQLAANLSEEQPGSPVEILAIAPIDYERLPMAVDRLMSSYARQQKALLQRAAQALQGRNVPFYTEVHMAHGVAEGIMEEIARRGDVRLLLMGWPGQLDPKEIASHPVAQLLAEARVDMAVFLNRGIVERPQRILVPFGGGIHSRLALHLAAELVWPQQGEVVALRCFCGCDPDGKAKAMELDEGSSVDVAYEEVPGEEAEMRDELMLACESIESEMGKVPENVRVKVISEPDIKQGILEELGQEHYDLVVMGAALAHTMRANLFGSFTDAVAEALPTSVLLVRRYEPEALSWIRRQVKEIVEPESEEAGVPEAP